MDTMNTMNLNTSTSVDQKSNLPKEALPTPMVELSSSKKQQRSVSFAKTRQVRASTRKLAHPHCLEEEQERLWWSPKELARIRHECWENVWSQPTSSSSAARPSRRCRSAPTKNPKHIVNAAASAATEKEDHMRGLEHWSKAASNARRKEIRDAILLVLCEQEISSPSSTSKENVTSTPTDALTEQSKSSNSKRKKKKSKKNKKKKQKKEKAYLSPAEKLAHRYHECCRRSLWTARVQGLQDAGVASTIHAAESQTVTNSTELTSSTTTRRLLSAKKELLKKERSEERRRRNRTKTPPRRIVSSSRGMRSQSPKSVVL